MNDADKEVLHSHKLEDGTEYVHRHDYAYKHSPEHTKAVLNRLSRASGHLEAVKRMVADGRDYSEVLVQLSAVVSALNSTGKVMLKEHMEHCVVDAVHIGEQAAIDNLSKAIDSFIK